MKVGWFVAAFFASVTAIANLTRLLPTPPNYEAAWWKVAAGVAGFALCIYFGVKENQNVRK